MLTYLPNMVACHLAIAQDARGPNNTIAVGDASSLLAMIEAAQVIERGHADIMIVGGAGSRLGIAALLYRGDENLSHRNEEPEAASRPFEAGRDGLVNGEGAASLILERRAHAEARGANVLASLAGYGRSFEPRLGVVPPSGDGTRRCVRDALKMAAVEPSQLSHVNAHGLSSPALDAVEAGALRDVIGDTLVTAPKSLFGNLGAGGGLVELVVSILSLQHGLVPGTLNYRQPDPQCPLNLSPETQAAAGRFALAVNQSATGQAASVVIQKPE
jgi:3-oxoacyl-[acyl-carrier-protein] synthase II